MVLSSAVNFSGSCLMLQMELPNVSQVIYCFCFFFTPFFFKKKQILSLCMLRGYIYTEIIVCECDLYENTEDLLIGNGLFIKTIVRNNKQLQFF